MHVLPEGVESTFRFILIAAKRAEQLIGGARARITSRHAKPTTVALDELKEGLVPWQRMTAEEYELMRQQESMAREREEQAPLFAPPAPPVPVLVEPEAEVEEEDDLEDIKDPGAEELLAEPVDE